MYRFILVLLLLALAAAPTAAQDPTPDTSQPPSVTAADQLSLDGMVTVESVFSPLPGWIAIHADVDNTPGPIVGIAPVQGGLNVGVRVMIDPLGATPRLWAMLHADDNTPGVFEFGEVEGADAPLQVDGQVVMQAFALTALRAFDQAISNDTVVAASVVSATGGWLVIHADADNAPGPVLGQTLVRPGTTPAVYVLLAGEGRTATLWPMLHVDDSAIGNYEFGTVEGADAPVVVNGQVATLPIAIGDTPTLMNAAGQPLPQGDGVAPYLNATGQDARGDGVTSTFFVNGVRSRAPGWIDVHAGMDGHPGKSLGMTAIPEGETFNVNVSLNAAASPYPPQTLPGTVWPMVHVDDGATGTYEYLKVPGLDLPVVLNGAVLTYPVRIDVVPVPLATPTAEATVEPTVEATPEATDDAEATPEATDGPEATPEATDGAPVPEETQPAPEETEVSDGGDDTGTGDGGGDGTIDATEEATAEA